MPPSERERRSEKAKSYQLPSASQSRTANDHRPRAPRTLSSTLVELRRADDTPATLHLQDEALRRGLPNVDGQDEDEVAGVVGAIRTFAPFPTPEVRCVCWTRMETAAQSISHAEEQQLKRGHS